jgi:hypothetical protein
VRSSTASRLLPISDVMAAVNIASSGYVDRVTVKAQHISQCCEREVKWVKLAMARTLAVHVTKAGAANHQ